MESLFLLTNQKIREEIGVRIKKHRLEMEFSQADLSRRTGISVHSISNIENGNDFTVDNLISILKALNLIDNINQLLPEIIANPYDVAVGVKDRQRRKRTKS